MRLRYTFESMDMGDNVILVPVGDEANNFHGVLKLNKEGYEITELLKDNISENEIVDKLAAKYDNEKSSLYAYVSNVIETLRKADLIEE